MLKKEIIKKGVCADISTGLNESFKRYNFSLLSPEEIFAKLNGGESFFKLDLSDAYLQVHVDDECSKLLIVNSTQSTIQI